MHDLLMQSVFVPFAVAFVAAAALRYALGAEHGPGAAGAAVAVGFLAAYTLIFGLPTVWPPSATQKLYFIAAIGGAAGLYLDLSRVARPVIVAVAFVYPIAALLWLGWARVIALDWLDISVLAIAAAAGIAVLADLSRARAVAAESGVKIVVAALALAVIALQGTSASYGQLSAALAAATAGFCLWLWPVARCRFGASALFGGGLVLIALTGAIAVFTTAPKAALCLLLPIFFADRTLGRLRAPRPILRPVLVGLVALVPAAAAVALAQMLGGSGY